MWNILVLSLLFISFQFAFGFNYFERYRVRRQESRCRNAPNGESGKCIVITACPPLFKLLRENRSDPEVRKLLLNSQCGFEGEFPKVCCKQDSPVTSKPPVPSGNDDKIPSHFPRDCGVSDVSASRIVGGRPAPLRAWPWIALLGYRSRDTRQPVTWKCGGTLITNKHVVTAAHCLADRVIIVRLGDLDVSTNTDGANHVDVPVERSITHEKYNKVQHTTDIGLLVLRNSVKFTPDVQPICLPFSEDIKTKSYVGFQPYIAGWGSLQYGESNYPTHLMEAQVEVKSIDECNNAYAKLGRTQVVIDDRVICAGGEKKDACQGDSGGPMMVIKGTQYYLLGVVSYGYKCAEVGFPGIYTKVTEFVDWIAKNSL